MKKCKYCGKKIDSNWDFCCNQCENNYKEVIDKDTHKINYFMSGIVIGFLIMLCGIFSSSDYVIGTGIILMGIVVVILPFATPETTTFFGYQKSKNIGRILGVLMIVVGIWEGFI